MGDFIHAMLLTLQTTSGKIIAFCTAAVLSEVVWWMYKKIKKQYSSNNEIVHKILFFDENGASVCSHHLTKPNVECRLQNCPVKKLDEIISYINAAKTSLDICIYFITFSNLGRAISNAFRRNVKVRIISDFDMSKENCNQIIKLKAEGLKIRSKKLNSLMHHKFVVIDKKIVITGSTNWTYQAFFGNYENVIITNQYIYVNEFCTEFERLWKIMDE